MADTPFSYAQHLVKSIFHKRLNMAQSNKFYSKQTSVFWACKAFLDGRTISHREAMKEIGAWRLGAIAHRLKREFGWPVEVEYRGSEKVAYYSLAPDVDTAKLRFPKSAEALGVEGV